MGTADKSINVIFTHIPKSTQEALAMLSGQSWLREQKWYLAGGTALALQCDHRTSVDLDFFNPRKNIDKELAVIVSSLAPDWITTNQLQDTLYGELHNTKISFIAYPYFTPQCPFIVHDGISILDARDIAVMKIIAISQRGKKRDFFDLYWYVHNREKLDDILLRVPAQYPNTQHNYHHILKSLTYFAEAETDPDPQIFFDANWNDVKKYFMSTVPVLANKFL